MLKVWILVLAINSHAEYEIAAFDTEAGCVDVSYWINQQANDMITHCEGVLSE